MESAIRRNTTSGDGLPHSTFPVPCSGFVFGVPDSGSGFRALRGPRRTTPGPEPRTPNTSASNQNLEPGTRNPEPGTRNQEPGTRNQEPRFSLLQDVPREVVVLDDVGEHPLDVGLV